ncbi:hypothetical protein HWN40_00220 [Methanolobus zinderi]|uniref:ABC transporter permease n=1 Tax=Methanolobus zinderi TaxID=536044 RepID=A0A7D5E6M3_9EURY|nr:hypothetical protein [Methanolobus zinderi]QLC48811.1 hypothetical protein HWN40_00220 [Methanolobus zinderi]
MVDLLEEIYNRFIVIPLTLIITIIILSVLFSNAPIAEGDTFYPAFELIKANIIIAITLAIGLIGIPATVIIGLLVSGSRN